jgi:hypothetical protein
MNDDILSALVYMASLANSRGDRALSAAFTVAADTYKRIGTLSATLAELHARRQGIAGFERAAADQVYNWLREAQSEVSPSD